MKLLIRADGGILLGNGHIVRMLSLAKKARIRGFEVEFAIKGDDFWINEIESQGFVVNKIPIHGDQVEEICRIIHFRGITNLIYDTRKELNSEQLLQIKSISNVFVCVIDTPEDTRLVADSVVYPPIQQLLTWNWSEFKGKIFSGWEYVILRDEFSTNLNIKRNKLEKSILLSFGATDPYCITEKVINLIAKNKSLFEGYNFLLIVGPQFDRLEVLNAMNELAFLGIKIIHNPLNISEIFLSVEFAIIAFGVTAYELAACGVPFLSISPTSEHEESVKLFETENLGFSLGTIDKLEENFADQIKSLLNYKSSNAFENVYSKIGSISNYDKILKAITNYE